MSLKKSVGFGAYIIAALGWCGLALLLGLLGAHFNRADECRGPAAERGVIVFGLPTSATADGIELVALFPDDAVAA